MIEILLLIYILHYLKGPTLWELWYTPHHGKCRMYIINRTSSSPSDAVYKHSAYHCFDSKDGADRGFPPFQGPVNSWNGVFGNASDLPKAVFITGRVEGLIG